MAIHPDARRDSITKLRREVGDKQASDVLYHRDIDYKAQIDKWVPVTKNMSALARAKFPAMMLNFYSTGEFKSQGIVSQDKNLRNQSDKAFRTSEQSGYTGSGGDTADAGFWSRLGASLKSTPERIARGFGSREISEGRTEVSKGPDFADIPGDIADVAGVALPFVGSILGSAAATPLAAAVTAIPVAGPALGLGALAAGGGAGGAVGEVARQTLGDVFNVEQKYGGQEVEGLDTKRVLQEAIYGTVGEIGGRIVAKGLGKVLAPFAKLDIERMDFMKDLGFWTPDQPIFEGGVKGTLKRIFSKEKAPKKPLVPVAAISDHSFLGSAQAVAARGFTGGPVRKIITESEERMIAKGTSLASEIAGGAPHGLESGAFAIEEAKEIFEKAWREKSKAAYASARAELSKIKGGLSKLDLGAPVQALNEVLDTPVKARDWPMSEVYKNLMKLRGTLKKAKTMDVERLLADADSMIDKLQFTPEMVSRGIPSKLKKVSAELKKAVGVYLKDNAPKAYEKIAEADILFREGREFFESNVGEALSRYHNNPEKIIPFILGQNSPSTVRTLMKLLDDGTKAGSVRKRIVQASILKKWVEDSFVGGDLTKSLFRTVKRADNSGVLKEVFEKDGAAKVLGFANVVREYTQNLSANLGAQVGLVGGKIFTLGYSIFSGQWLLASAIIASDVGLTKMFSTKVGIKYLSTGLKLPESKVAHFLYQIGTRSIPRFANEQ